MFRPLRVSRRSSAEGPVKRQRQYVARRSMRTLLSQKAVNKPMARPRVEKRKHDDACAETPRTPPPAVSNPARHLIRRRAQRKARKERAAPRRRGRPRNKDTPRGAADDADKSLYKENYPPEPTASSTPSSAATPTVDTGPPERTRAEIEMFAKAHLIKLEQKQDGVEALRCRIGELELQASKMTARYQIHERRDLEKTVRALRRNVQQLETGAEVREFKRDTARALKAFDDLEDQRETQEQKLKEKEEERVAREAERASIEVEEPIGLNAVSVEERRQAIAILENDDKNVEHVEAPAALTMVVNKDAVERRRHVAKPDMRVLKMGKTSSTVVADTFLERHGGVDGKPLCMISDEQCIECHGRLVHDVASDIFVCEDCRYEQTMTQAGDRNIGYNNSVSMTFSSCRYRRETHFANHLDRFCGLVGSEKITDALIYKVMGKLKEMAVPKDDVTPDKVQEALKLLGRNELKHHKVIICVRITGKLPKRFAPVERTQLMEMFRPISAAFDELKRLGRFPDRVNYLSYPYTIFKFLEMLTWGHKYKQYFHVLSGPENLARQDVYWKACCEHVGFRFIPSS